MALAITETKKNTNLNANAKYVNDGFTVVA
jgi:hypothetical protein